MARKSLFSIGSPATKERKEADSKLADHGGDDGGIAARGEAPETGSEQAPKVVGQTPAQRRAAIGVEESLVTALADKADDKTIGESLREQAARCGELTLQRLTQGGQLSGGEAQSILESYGYYVDDVKLGQPILDLLAFHVWVKLDAKDEKAEKEIRDLAIHLNSVVPTGATHCSFSRVTDTPGELYEKFPLAEKICSTLMCPAVQAHERDFVSVASVNPVTAAVTGYLLEQVLEREGVRPFTFVLTMDAGKWAELCHKQFGIEV